MTLGLKPVNKISLDQGLFRAIKDSPSWPYIIDLKDTNRLVGFFRDILRRTLWITFLLFEIEPVERRQ